MDKSTIKTLKKHGVMVECESPLELSTEDGSVCTGAFADFFVSQVENGEVTWEEDEDE